MLGAVGFADFFDNGIGGLKLCFKVGDAGFVVGRGGLLLGRLLFRFVGCKQAGHEGGKHAGLFGGLGLGGVGHLGFFHFGVLAKQGVGVLLHGKLQHAGAGAGGAVGEGEADEVGLAALGEVFDDFHAGEYFFAGFEQLEHFLGGLDAGEQAGFLAGGFGFELDDVA